tara:strand:- start:10929 stop:11153 length:225 start_codon:yes stop_codon:yes gene_type:complete
VKIVTKQIQSHHTKVGLYGLIGMYKEMLEEGLIEKNGAAHTRYKNLVGKREAFAKWKNIPKSLRENIIKRSKNE